MRAVLVNPRGTALLLVDIQRDYLDREGLVPEPDQFVASVAKVLGLFRAAGAPVAHVRTVVRADRSDAMPHWGSATTLCVAGSSGVEAPAGLEARSGEYVATKQHYRGFADPGLDAWLRACGVDTIAVAGLYTHACVRETALDAYERGYQVMVLDDAVATNDPEHAAATRRWMDGRSATFMSSSRLDFSAGPPLTVDPQDEVVRRAQAAQVMWAAMPANHRRELVCRLADEVQARRVDLTEAIVDEIAKSRAAAADEVERAVSHLRTAGQLAAPDEPISPGVVVRHVPLGVVAALTPWNNPVALPAGKIGPALALGNAVVLKPAPEGSRCADLLVEVLVDAGAPPDLIGVLHGGAPTGAALVRHPGISGVAVTGSVATGRAVAATCAARFVPLQAELGGNNAAIVMPDADLDVIVPDLVSNAFAFAGQRCTAIRRLVVHQDILDQVIGRMRASVNTLPDVDSVDDRWAMGPMISATARDRVARSVDAAIVGGAALVAQGPDREDPAFFRATVLLVDDPGSAIVQQESFGPVLVIQPAIDLDHALSLANGVEQGLLVAACTTNVEVHRQILASAKVGIVQMGSAPVPIHPDAPFGGWKASSIGTPEHGRWDAQFFTRPQAVYTP